MVGCCSVAPSLLPTPRSELLDLDRSPVEHQCWRRLNRLLLWRSHGSRPEGVPWKRPGKAALSDAINSGAGPPLSVA